MLQLYTDELSNCHIFKVDKKSFVDIENIHTMQNVMCNTKLQIF